MRIQMLVYGIAVGGIFFASGVAVGQRVSPSKFARYLEPAVRTKMDLIALESNLALIRSLMPRDNGMSTPRVYFNAKEGRPEASVDLSVGFEKFPRNTIESQIKRRYYLAYAEVREYIPNLSENDFVLHVYRADSAEVRLFADCRDGNVAFR